MSFKVKPVSSTVAKYVRETMLSPFGKNLPAFSAVATGYGPCRVCLRTFTEGEENRLYVTYDPMEGFFDLPQPGPIFIHSDECQEYTADGFPPELRHIPLLFEAFGDDSELLRREAMNEASIETQIGAILRSPGVKVINVRNAEAGCFVARIERPE